MTCVFDDSTECECDRCTAADERFWREQGEGDESDPSDSEHSDEDDDEPVIRDRRGEDGERW